MLRVSKSHEYCRGTVKLALARGVDRIFRESSTSALSRYICEIGHHGCESMFGGLNEIETCGVYEHVQLAGLAIVAGPTTCCGDSTMKTTNFTTPFLFTRAAAALAIVASLALPACGGDSSGASKSAKDELRDACVDSCEEIGKCLEELLGGTAEGDCSKSCSDGIDDIGDVTEKCVDAMTDFYDCFGKLACSEDASDDEGEDCEKAAKAVEDDCGVDPLG